MNIYSKFKETSRIVCRETHEIEGYMQYPFLFEEGRVLKCKVEEFKDYNSIEIRIDGERMDFPDFEYGDYILEYFCTEEEYKTIKRKSIIEELLE